MDKIKILHRLSTEAFGGMEKYVLENYKYIDKSKFTFEGFSRSKELLNQAEIIESGIKVNLFQSTGSDPNFRKEINEILSRGYDVLHMNTSYWSGFMIEEIAMNKHIPKVIVHSHSIGVDHVDEMRRVDMTKRHQYYKQLFNENYATHFCACSYAAADWLFGEQIPRDKIIILKNAIDVKKFVFNRRIRKKIREEMEYHSNFVIGHVGRFNYSKNHRFLIDIFNDIHKFNPDTRLLLVGDGGYEDQTKKQVESYGLSSCVSFMGWRKDTHKLLQAMDLFLLPSYFEGLPISLIEAQAAGLPCIASKFVTQEVNITNKVKFLDLDKEKWINEINRIISNNTQRCDMSQKITEAGYNIHESVKILEKLYQS